MTQNYYHASLSRFCRLEPSATRLAGFIAVLTLIFCFQVQAMIDLTAKPDAVHVTAETGAADKADSDLATITFKAQADGLHLLLSAPHAAIKKLQLHWAGKMDASSLCLGDAWERSYADLEWKPLAQSGPMPWYFLTTANHTTDAYGVMTQPRAMCHWLVDADGITLVADVRSGGSGVQLGERTLDVCTIVTRAGKENEEPFDAAVAFCRQMCPHPRLPKLPVYGFNDWNSTYGHNTAAHFLKDGAALAALTPQGPNRPYMVVDDGWQANRQGGKSSQDQWDRTNAAFGSTMPDLADGVKKLNAHPGLWYRPLETWSGAPKAQRLSGRRNVFDPSIPEVRTRIGDDVKRFRSWGFELLKFDFTTVEMLGKFGKDLGGQGTPDGWAFADRSKTTAEIISELYQTIRDAAGDGMVIDGCNTISHLSAGVFELYRIGDDTSGQEWNRTRDYGVNTLAFRASQQGTFYQVDPDMVGLAKAGAVEWSKNSQWLNLVSHSGTTLIVSWKTDLLSDEVKAAMRDAFAAAALPQPVARPLDWTTTRLPAHWLLDGKEVNFSW